MLGSVNFIYIFFIIYIFNIKNNLKKLLKPYYCAPEIFKRKYDAKCDIWSVGVILY